MQLTGAHILSVVQDQSHEYEGVHSDMVRLHT